MTSLIIVLISAHLTDLSVYNVDPAVNCVLSAGKITQEFIATSDNISRISFFCGRKTTRGAYKIYLSELDGSPVESAPIGYTDSAGLFENQLINFDFQVPVHLKRGFRYLLNIENTRALPFEVLCNNRNLYLPGRLRAGYATDLDLAGSILGFNDPSPGLFGINSCLTVTAHEQPDSFRYQGQWKSCIDSMQAMGITWDRPGHCAWQHIQPGDPRQSETGNRTFEWSWCDSLISCYARDSIKVLWLFTQSTRWASCDPHDTDGWYDGFPRNLFEPVFKNPGEINPDNYFAQYVYNFVKRYGPSGYFWRNRKVINPVVYLEMWNEPEWALRNFWHNDSVKYLIDPVYRRLYYDLGQKESFMSLYARLCVVGDSAAKAASLKTKTIIYVPFHYWEKPPLIDTRDWLTFLDSKGLSDHCDGLSFHTYALDSSITPMPPPYFHERQKLNLDSLWKIIMEFDNFKNKFIWCTEFGTGFFNRAVDEVATERLFNRQAQFLVKTVIGFLSNDPPEGPLSNSFLWAYSTRYYPDVWENKRVAITNDSFYCRPTGFAYRQLLKLTKNCRYLGVISHPQSDPSLRVFSFANIITGRQLYVGWKEKPSSSMFTPIRLPVQTDAAYQYDLSTIPNGSPDKLIADRDGWINALLTESPIYIVEPEILGSSRPDLIIDTAWCEPAVPKAGENFTITCLIRNIGNSDFRRNIAYDINRDGITVDRGKISGPIKPKGKISLVSGPITGQVHGSFFFKISVNSPMEVVEADSLNNHRFLYVQVKP